MLYRVKKTYKRFVLVAVAHLAYKRFNRSIGWNGCIYLGPIVLTGSGKILRRSKKDS